MAILYPGKFYVYTHAVSGVVFYVGKGSRERAFATRDRNKKWQAIVDGAGRYEVTVVDWFDNAEAALDAEREMIKRIRPAANVRPAEPAPRRYRRGVRPGLINGHRLREARTGLRLTQKEWARRYNVSRATVNAWERDVSKPSYPHAFAMRSVVPMKLWGYA